MASVSVKVIRGDEIRRFILESMEDNPFHFPLLINQIGNIFPDLRGKMDTDKPTFKLTWKDNEGDNVTLSSDPELMEAIRALPPGAALRVHLTETEKTTEKEKEKSSVQFESATSDETEAQSGMEEETVEPGLHRHVFCDGCKSDIRGIRFKCLTCPDFDLCSGCIDKTKHDQHCMIRITSPVDKSWKVAFRASQRHIHHGHGRRSRSGSGSHSPPSCHRLQHKYCHFKRPRSRSHSHSPVRHHHAPPTFGPIPPIPPMFGQQMFTGMIPPFEGRGRGRWHGHQASRGHHFGPPFGRHCWAYTSCPGKCYKGHKKEGEKGPGQTTQQNNEQPQDLMQQLTENLEQAMNNFGISSPVHTGSTTEQGTTAGGSVTTGGQPDPVIQAALNYMLAMGYTNEGGWLTKLLEEKHGDVSAVLDVLHPNGQ